MLDQLLAVRPEEEIAEAPTRHRALIDWVAAIAAHIFLATRPWGMWRWAATVLGALGFVAGGRNHPETLPWLAGGVLAVIGLAAGGLRPSFYRHLSSC